MHPFERRRHTLGGRILYRVLIAACFLLTTSLFSSRARAQTTELEQELQIRLGAAVRKKLAKDWMLQLSPQIRTDGINPDRYLLELEGGYEPIKYIDLRAMFRGDLEETGSGLEHGYRPGASVTGSLPLGDFKPSLRTLYTYSFGPERDARHRLRYRAKVDYNVPQIRLEISPGVEVFHQLDNRGIYKMRYSLSLEYKFMKSKKIDQFLYGGYMLDYSLDKRRNVHIPEFGYKVVFD
jgi:hypothetical protein